MKTRKGHGDSGPVGPLDRRVERFVQRYVDSPLKLDLLRCLGQRPNRSYSFLDLGGLIDSDASEVERAVFYFERLGIVGTRRERQETLVSLSRSPVVRESAVSTFRYTTQPGGYAHLKKLITSKRPGPGHHESGEGNAGVERQPEPTRSGRGRAEGMVT